MKYHLEIVLQISLELCEIYKNADKDLVEAIVWIHDYAKMLDFDYDDEMLMTEGYKALKIVGFEENFIKKVMEYTRVLEKKMEVDLNTAPIEVKIVSSADGASHLVGPFYYLWWYENPEKPYEELMEDNRRKADKDWKRKIVLPEVKKVFKQRHRFQLEQSGDIPSIFLSRRRKSEC